MPPELILANQQAGTNNMDVTPWAQFGLAGAVICAAFSMIMFMYKQHHAERSDWRDDIKEIAKNHDAAVKENTDRFIVLHEKTLDAVRDRQRGS